MFPGFFRSVYSLAFLPGGGFLVGGGYEAAGRDVTLWEVPGARVVWQHDRYMPRSVAVSPDGSGSRSRAPTTPTSRSGPAEPADRPRLRRAFEADPLARLLPRWAPPRFGGADHVVKVWRVPDFTEEAQLVGHTAPVWSVAFSPTGSTWRPGRSTAPPASGGVRPQRVPHVLPGGTGSGRWPSPRRRVPGLGRLRSHQAVPRRVGGDGAGGECRSDSSMRRLSSSRPDGRYLVSALADNVKSTPGAIKVWSVSR